MALATRCPACTTVFRISTAQAAAKGGMVRCGQCRNVFNSLDALVRVEDLEVIDEVFAAGPPPTVAERSVPPSPLDPRSRPVPTPEAPMPVRPLEQPAEFASFTLPEEAPRVASDAAPAPVKSEWWLPEPSRGDPRPVETPSVAPEPALPMPTATSPVDVSADRPDVREPVADDGIDDRSPGMLRPLEMPVAPAAASRWLFGVLALLAFLLLLGEGAYMGREELAARWSPARPWLIAACERLHCRVEAPAHLEAITIESASVAVLPANPDLYVLTALLRNRETIAIRHPHLELVLTDVQDRPILRRALRPEDYLPAGRTAVAGPDAAGFPAESELSIRVMFELTDLRFAGYRLDRFYP